MDEVQNKTVSEKPKHENAPGVAPKFRYYCDSCTGIAFKSVEKKNPGVAYCQSCGKAVGPEKEENYIPL